MENIFDNMKETVTPEWAKFVEAGDSAQGTYVGKIVGAIDGFGNEQIVYQLLQEDGSIVNVGMSLGKKVINEVMATVKFGQMVKINYKGMATFYDKRTKKEGKAKDFTVQQDPKVVNEAWLAENKDNMPEVIYATEKAASGAEALANELKAEEDGVPFN